MSKLQRQVSASKHGVVHNELYDDNMLPPAEELARLKEVDPSLIQWLMQQHEAEQKFRHQAYNSRSDVLKQAVANEYKLNSRGLNFCFTILLVGIAIGGFLIFKGLTLQGSIFSGITLVLAAGLLYRHKNTKDNKDA